MMEMEIDIHLGFALGLDPDAWQGKARQGKARLFKGHNAICQLSSGLRYKYYCKKEKEGS